MRVAIDAVGRVVIPKSLREELGINGPANLELIATDGRLELTVADVPAHVETQNGLPVIVTDEPMAPMSVAATREAIERVRRRALRRANSGDCLQAWDNAAQRRPAGTRRLPGDGCRDQFH